MNEIEQICEEQGWDENSMVTLLLQFVEEQKLTDKLAEFLQSQADEENQFSEEV